MSLRNHLPRKLFSVLLFFRILSPIAIAQDSQIPGELKEFLESRSFPELIASHGQDQISVYIEGREVKAIAARPYTIEKGYRCQTFASADYANAYQAAEKARALKLDSVYVIESENLFKVQMGNFKDRRSAEILLDRLKYAGVKGAWIVETEVHIPKTAREMQAIEQQQMIRQQAAQTKNIYYAIQVLATNDLAKAEQLKATIENDYKQSAEIIRQESIWKVLVGRFSNRNEAESLLQILKRQNFSDAWITQVTSI
jgi:cell division septation protein DedD